MFSQVFLIAFMAGMIPALLWLGFWLLEDKRNPEPKAFIFFTFLAGMAVVLPLVLPIERFICAFLLQQAACPSNPPLKVLFGWAMTEELFKFIAAYVAALHWRVFDEPLDAVVYMITAALGFAAFENMLFLANPISDGQFLQTVITGDLRFVGATLLHVLSSATIGLILAYAFYKSQQTRRLAIFVGVILATTLHAAFNFFILNKGGSATFLIFLVLWFGIVALLLFIERIKRFARNYR